MPQLGGMLALGIGMAWFFCALCDVEARGSGMACTHFMDYWTYVFGGMGVYLPDGKTPFEFPAPFLAAHLLGLFQQGYYWGEDRKCMEAVRLLGAGGRKRGLAAKWLWNLAAAAGYYLCLYGAMALYCVCRGNVLDFGGDAALERELFGVSYIASGCGNALKLMSCVLLAGLALHGLVFLLSFFVGGAAGMLFSAACLGASAYWATPWLAGNLAMPLRSTLAEEGPFPVGLGMGAATLLLAGTLLAGLFFIRKYNFLDKEERI